MPPLLEFTASAFPWEILTRHLRWFFKSVYLFSFWLLGLVESVFLGHLTIEIVLGMKIIPLQIYSKTQHNNRKQVFIARQTYKLQHLVPVIPQHKRPIPNQECVDLSLRLYSRCSAIASLVNTTPAF